MLRLVSATTRLLTEFSLVLLVLGVALGVFGEAARTVRFHDDESAYIRAAEYFSHLFVRPDLGRNEWGDNRTTHTQGLVPSYLIGGWLLARGYELEDLHVRAFEEQLAEVDTSALPLERVDGELIDVALLRDSRAPMAMVGAAAIGALYLIGRVLAGQIAGLATAALALASPLSKIYLGQARSEPALAFFVLLALLLAVIGARRGRAGKLPLRWALACGLALGLAIGSKHTAILSLVALKTWGALVAAWSARGPGAVGARARLISAWAAGRGWALAAGVGLAVFVLGNPHFYSDPPLHLWHLVEARRQVVLEHRQEQPRRVVDGRVERIRMVVGRAVRRDTATGSRGVPLEAFLAPLGAGALLLTTVRGALRTGHPPAEGLVLVTVATYFVGIAAGISVAWERYFLPTLLLGTILSGVGLVALLRLLPILWTRVQPHRPGLVRRAAQRLG